MDSPKTRRAVIIGATSGIGYEVAQLLLAEGWYLGIARKTPGKSAGISEEISRQNKNLCTRHQERRGRKRTGETNRGTGRHGFVSTKFRYRFPEF